MKLIFIFVSLICIISHGNGTHTVNEIADKVQFDDLNDDMLMEIFHKLNFDQLLGFADMNYRFRGLVTHHYIIPKYRFHEKILEIKPRFIHGENENNIMINVNGSISVHEPQLTLKIIRNFGYLFKIISLNHFSYSVEWRERISAYINEYCHDSLEELKLDIFYEYLLLEWKKPFENVRKLQFDKGTWNCENTNLNCTEIFPSLHHLNIEQITYSSSKCIDYHFPSLEHIQFPMYANYPTNMNKMYEQVFQLNPQLRSIQIRNVDDVDLLRVASKTLHHLEAIDLAAASRKTIRFNISDGEIIHFKNVKRFHIALMPYNARDETEKIPLKFDQLEEMVFLSAFDSQKWVEFIAQQQKLRTLTVLWGSTGFTFEQWMSIIENTPQLEVIKTYWKSKIGNNGIAKVMATKTDLKKIILVGLSRQHYDIFRQFIDDEQWQIEGDVKSFMAEATFVRR